MKKIYQYIALAALALGFAACTQEDDFTPQGNQKNAPLAIASAGVANLTTRATITTTDGTDYLTGGSIGVFVASTTDNDNYKGTNLEWKYENNAWTAAASDTKVLFEADGTKQTFGAYYPYVAELTDGTCTIELPEAFDSNYETYDYLYADYAALTENPMSVTMKHLLSKVTVSINSTGSEIANGDAVAGISLLNVPRTAVWTVPATTLSNYGTADQTTALYETAGNYVGYALPNGATTLNLRVTMDSGRMFKAKAPISGSGMTAGVHYKIGLNVGKDKVEVGSVTVEPWGTGVEPNGGVAYENVPSIDGAEYTSLSALKEAVKEKLSEDGVTSVTINGYLSDEMHAAIVSTINEVNTEGAVTHGSLLAGSVTYTVYSTFTDAVAAWTDGTTLTMLGDETGLTEKTVISAENLILDLNGYTLYSSSARLIQLGESGSLTIRDSKGDGYVNGVLVSDVGSKLYLEGGTVKDLRANGDFVMTGGCIKNPNGVGLFTSVSSNRMVISGGEITGSSYAIWASYGGEFIITGSAKINGGTGGLFYNANDAATITITGGTFSHNPTDWVDTENYTVTESDGVYTVAKK